MTKHYQIYGMGNALVDFEIETTVEELASLNIEKGVMTLIEQEQQQKLMSFFADRLHSRACGGSAANTIIGAQSLGSKCFYSCKVASDETGVFYRDDLVEEGVDTNLSTQKLVDGDTGKCLVMVTDDADRTMNTFLGVTADIDYQQIDETALQNADYLYVEGYLSSSPTGLKAACQAMQFARDNQVKTAFSLSDPNMVKFCREGLEQIIGEGVDILFCNYDEATEYSNSNNLDDAINYLKPYAQTLVITLGADGAVIYETANESKIEIKGHKVKAIDTNGAGDLFAGSFLHAVCSGKSLQQAGDIASYASAQLVTQFSPRLNQDNLAKVKDYLKETAE